MKTGLDNEKEYYTQLKKFEDICYRLIDNGQPYLTVILCHELYRFIEPAEPYTNFFHDDPVPFITRHIDQLIGLADHFSEVVIPYSINLNNKTYEKYLSKRETADLSSDLEKENNNYTVTEESIILLKNRLPDSTIASSIKGKNVLDMGCGSGRYSITLAALGANKVTAIDGEKAYIAAEKFCSTKNLPVQYYQGDIFCLPFENEEFDFVFCNRISHHTQPINHGLKELYRVLKKDGEAFIYIYGSGGIFWTTRITVRKIFEKISPVYTKDMLYLLGMPANRFSSGDTWYGPAENYTKKRDLEQMLKTIGFDFKKLVSKNSTDLDNAIANESIRNAKIMWGEGEHRYLLHKK
jgi:2-polyprenyl-3-methyl-5-hydroxy-6-metoxy-1,4-benzoquinol methylase